MTRRRCSKPSCNQAAVSTLTYVYADSTAVVGPLATYAEPHCYDLCQMHSERLTAPLGWEVVRITPDPDALKPSSDDLEALANAVREAARPRYMPGGDGRGDRSTGEVDGYDPSGRPGEHGTVEVARRGHLRVLQSIDSFESIDSPVAPVAAGPAAGTAAGTAAGMAADSFADDRLGDPFDHAVDHSIDTDAAFGAGDMRDEEPVGQPEAERADEPLGTYDDPFGAHRPRAGYGSPREELVREPFADDGLPFDELPYDD